MNFDQKKREKENEMDNFFHTFNLDFNTKRWIDFSAIDMQNCKTVSSYSVS